MSFVCRPLVTGTSGPTFLSWSEVRAYSAATRAVLEEAELEEAPGGIGQTHLQMKQQGEVGSIPLCSELKRTDAIMCKCGGNVAARNGGEFD